MSKKLVEGGAILSVLVACCGCQMGRVFYTQSIPTGLGAEDGPRFVLAANYLRQTEPPLGGEGDGEEKKSEDPEQEKRSDESTESEAKPLPYTVPAAPYQQLAVLAVGLAAFGTTSDDLNYNREAAESQMATSSPIDVGRPGISAPPRRVTSAIVSRPGLQQGIAIGLGPASDRNIFTAGFSMLSGPQGRCQELVTAGFFNGNRSQCESSFRASAVAKSKR